MSSMATRRKVTSVRCACTPPQVQPFFFVIYSYTLASGHTAASSAESALPSPRLFEVTWRRSTHGSSRFTVNGARVAFVFAWSFVSMRLCRLWRHCTTATTVEKVSSLHQMFFSMPEHLTCLLGSMSAMFVAASFQLSRASAFTACFTWGMVSPIIKWLLVQKGTRNFIENDDRTAAFSAHGTSSTWHPWKGTSSRTSLKTVPCAASVTDPSRYLARSRVTSRSMKKSCGCTQRSCLTAPSPQSHHTSASSAAKPIPRATVCGPTGRRTVQTDPTSAMSVRSSFCALTTSSATCEYTLASGPSYATFVARAFSSRRPCATTCAPTRANAPFLAMSVARTSPWRPHCGATWRFTRASGHTAVPCAPSRSRAPMSSKRTCASTRASVPLLAASAALALPRPRRCGLTSRFTSKGERRPLPVVCAVRPLHRRQTSRRTPRSTLASCLHSLRSLCCRSDAASAQRPSRDRRTCATTWSCTWVLSPSSARYVARHFRSSRPSRATWRRTWASRRTPARHVASISCSLQRSKHTWHCTATRKHSLTRWCSLCHTR